MRVVVAAARKRAAITFNHALVAQRIEQEPSNLLVAGSSPAEGTIKTAENKGYLRIGLGFLTT